MTDALAVDSPPQPSGCSSPRAASLEDALLRIHRAASGSGRALGRAELLRHLGEVYEGDPLAAFEQIRAAASGSGAVGAVSVRSEGERRGAKYVFGVAPTHSTATPAAAPDERHDPARAGRITVLQGDNLTILNGFAAESFDLIYIDPPFNTGRAQARTRIKTDRDECGDRTGYKGQRYKTTVVGSSHYADRFDDYMGFLIPRLQEALRLLKPSGSFFLHLDYREVHYAKVALDRIFGRDSFINEIIWAYDYGARATNRWSPKHDNILWYAKDPDDYCFNYEEIDRIPYMAPSLVGAEKAARGKTPTDAWWNTIVSPNGKEKTGYPTQKPLSILTRIVRVHSNPGDRLLDFFAGSGSFGDAAASLGRDVVLIDENPEAIDVMRRRLAKYDGALEA